MAELKREFMFIMTIEEFNNKMMNRDNTGTTTTELDFPQEEKEEKFFGQRIFELIRVIRDMPCFSNSPNS